MSAVRTYPGSKGKGGEVRAPIGRGPLTARGIISGRPRKPEGVA